MNTPNLSGLRGYVRPRRVGLGPEPFSPPPTGEVPGLDPSMAPRPQRVMGELEQAFTAQTPQEQNYQTLQTNGPADPKAGIWERIKGALLSGGLAAQQAGNQNPEAQGAALLGGLLGGGISRRFAGNMQHNLRDLPQARGLAAESREIADAGLGRRMGFAKAYGYDPQSGTDTADTQRYEQERMSHEQQAQQRALMEQFKAIMDTPGAKISGGLARAIGRPEYADTVVPTKPVAPLPPHWVMDRNGGYVDLNAATGPVQGKDPNAMTPYQQKSLELRARQGGGQITPYQQYQQNRNTQQDAKAQEEKAQGLAKQYSDTRAEHAAASNEYGRMMTEIGNPSGKDSKGNPMAVWNGKALTLAMADEAKIKADKIGEKLSGLKQIAGQHPNLEFGESGDIKLKKGSRASTGGGSTITADEYAQQVKKHGQQKVDEWLAGKKISVQ